MYKIETQFQVPKVEWRENKIPTPNVLNSTAEWKKMAIDDVNDRLDQEYFYYYRGRKKKHKFVVIVTSMKNKNDFKVFYPE